jgi:hypothetical protein
MDKNKAVQNWFKTTIWSTPNLGIICLEKNGNTYIIRNNRWQQNNSILGNNNLQGHSNQIFLVPPQPSDSAIITSSDESSGLWIHSVSNEKIVSEKKISELEKEAIHLGAPSNCKLIINTLSENEIFFTVTYSTKSHGQRLFGVAKADLKNLNIIRINPLVFPNIVKKISLATKLLVAFPDRHEDYILVSIKNEGYENSWIAWRLFVDAPPKQIIRHFFISEGLKSRRFAEHMLGDPLLKSLDWLPSGKIVISIENDSKYLLDLQTGEAKIFFQPGSELFKVRIGRNGMTAIFAEGGFNCFIFNTKTRN